MKHLVIGQRLKTPHFSAFHWSPRGCLVSIGQHFVATRVVHLPKNTKTITESDLITSYCSYTWPAQPGLILTRLCWPWPSLEDCDSLHPTALRTAKTLWRFAVQNAIWLKELPLKNCLFMALLIQSHNLLF